jgi:CubicO group peptidase (beta-lactamase class C family)
MTSQSCDIWKKCAAQFIICLAILMVLFGSGCSTISPTLQDEYRRAGLSEGMSETLNQYRQTVITKMSKNTIPGISLALVDRDGIIWSAGFGYTDYSRNKPVTADTLFLINSMSKTITATAVMVAVRDGLVDLDVPIIEYYPQFRVNSRFEENPQTKITLRHLLTHTAGLANEAPVGNAREPSYLSIEEHIQSISTTWLKHKVGEGHNYSGLGYDLAAYILQLRSSQPYATYLKDKVFAPLNMPNCSVDPELIKSQHNRAVGYMPYVKQLPLAWDVPHIGAGGVYANAIEMARFIQVFINQGKVDNQIILDAKLIKSMETPTIYCNSYGMGVGISYDDHGFYRLGHSGWAIGFTSAMEWLPEYEIGFVFLANSDVPLPFGSDGGDILLELINKKLVEKMKSLEAPSNKTINVWLDPKTFSPYKPEWKKYIGTYKYVMKGYKFEIPAAIALALGVTTGYTHVKICEKDGYLYIDSIIFHDDDGGRLNEYLPGLFFTPSGKCLDLRGPKLTWENYRIEKVKRLF